METITIGRAEFENLKVIDNESSSVALLVSVDEYSQPLINKTAIFVDGEAVIELLGTDTDIPVGDYVYQIRLFDTDGEFFNLRSEGCTDDSCTFGTFTICPSLGESVS